MKFNSEDAFRLQHILDATNKITILVEKVQSFSNFEKQWIEQAANIRFFEIIGEASHHISNTLKEKYPEVEWNKIRAMRNYMAHEYFEMQLETIWKTAEINIPFLHLQIQHICDDLNAETSQ